MYVDWTEKNVLVTGGTGSFGRPVIRYLLSKAVGAIRVFSRDEKKQEEVRQEFPTQRVRSYIGDVRDPLSVSEVVKGVDYIFHAAALKQVPSCEFFPIEAVKTNVIGTDNVLESSIRHKVKKVVAIQCRQQLY